MADTNTDACPDCGSSLRGGRFTSCPTCGFDLKANKPSVYGTAYRNPAPSQAPNYVASPFSALPTSLYPPQQTSPYYALQAAPTPSFNLFASLFSFKGRLNRAPYIWLSIGTNIFFLASLLAVFTVFVDSGDALLITLTSIIGVMFVWVKFALPIKRLHDMNMAGWHMIWILPLSLIPLINLAVMLWMWCASGTNGANLYGPPMVFIKGLARTDLS